jgi:CRISPR system Cascade subunit CasB
MPRQTPVPKEADSLAREITRLIKRSPGERSVLRHSLGKRPEEVAVGVHRIVVPLLPRDAPEGAERAYYTVAALIASQPRQARDQAATDDTAEAPSGGDTAPDEPAKEAAAPAARPRHNLGYSLAQAAHGGVRNLEGRLQLLARQDANGVYRHLPRLILQLRAEQVRIDWGVLTRDLTRWERTPRLVAKEWAQEFYRADERLTAEAKRKAEKAASSTSNQEA